MTETDKIEIIADDREPPELTEALGNIEGIEVAIDRLKLGDYLVDPDLLFERKTLPDFAESIKSGRIFQQGCRLASAKHRAVLILEGTSKDALQSGMSRESVQGAIISLTIILGLPMLRSQSKEESARLIAYTARQMERLPHGAIYRHGYRPKGERKRKLFVLQGLPGIGPERAERLLDHFGSLEAVFFAEEDEIADVTGIGYPTAQRIRKLVREHNPENGYSVF